MVYWKSLAIGTGPAVILKAFDQEILKFDCFGEEKGHFHIAPQYDFRIYFVEKTVEEQIHRTIKELKNNGLRYLAMQRDERIKKLQVDKDSYLKLLDQVEKSLFTKNQLISSSPDKFEKL